MIQFSTTTTPDLHRIQTLINTASHIHSIDMPYRLTSTWQGLGCKIGLWEKGSELLAFALFQPPWWNLDYAIHPAVRDSSLHGQVLTWGRDQIIDYAQRTGESFWGSIEFFDTSPNTSPHTEETRSHLETLGFTPFEWSTKRFAITLDQTLPQPQLPAGYTIRPLAGPSEVAAYVDLHRAAFESDKMTIPWRERALTHPAYRPEIDLVAVDAADQPVGFCVCWMGKIMQEKEEKLVGQIEPLGVHPDHQGSGLGRALELTALHTMAEHGAQTALVDHVSLNEAAIALSLQTGFVQVNNALRYYIEVP